METDTFEKAFEQFLDCQEYDAAQDALYTLARSAFKAGWQAASGNPPTQLIVQPVPNQPDK